MVRAAQRRNRTPEAVKARVADIGDKSEMDGDRMSGALVPRGEEGGIRFVQFAPQPPFDDRLIFWQKRTSDTAAAFRLLRQRLIERGDPRVVLCTSAGRREGKTTLAANLAMAYAELGRHRVLLLEASFRVAALGEVFGFLPPRGFAGSSPRTARDRRTRGWWFKSARPRFTSWPPSRAPARAADR